MNEREIAESALSAAGVNLANEKFTIDDVIKGMKVEYEHGSWGTAEGLPPSLNVIEGDKKAAANIALAHLLEKRDGEHQYDYYDGLEIIESAPAGFFRNQTKKYWQISLNSFILIVVILLIALFLFKEYAYFTEWTIVLLCLTLLFLRPDYRCYIV